MMNSITNIIVDNLKNDLKYPNTVREYPQTNPKFPCIVVEEGDLSVDNNSLDSGGYRYNNYQVTLEIFTTGTQRVLQSENIRNDINNLLSGEYRLERIFSESIPNMGDMNIYRYKMVFVGKLDKNKTIYGR